MRGGIAKNYTRKLVGGVVILPMMLASAAAEKPDLSANAMLGKMDVSDHYPFIAGIIEGIAYHRYITGNKDKAAMDCVYDWFYEDDKSVDTIYVALAKFPSHPPAAVIAALANRKCEE